MPLDYQKQEAKQCLWDQDGSHTKKKSRNRGKGRGKDKKEIRETLKELLKDPALDHEDMMNVEAFEASYCHYYGPCERCKARDSI